MASLIQQATRCILSRNFNLVKAIAANGKSFHAVSCVPAVAKVNIAQYQFQSLQFSTQTDIEQRVLKVVGSYDKISADKLKLDSHFIQDLGLDSLDHVEVIMAMEDEFGFEIPDNDAEKLSRVSDIVKYISQKDVKDN